MHKRWPVNSGVLTTAQGERSNPIRGYHPGIDIASAPHDAILAAAEGTVCAVYKDKLDETVYGNRVFIDHPDGSQTRYNHLSEFHCERGQKVEAGQQIGAMGKSGRNNTGVHLDFEVLDTQTTDRASIDIGYDHFVDPLKWLPDRPSWLKLGSGVTEYEGRVVNMTEADMRESGEYNRSGNRYGPYREI